MTKSINQWGDFVLAVHTEVCISSVDPLFSSESHWELQEVSEKDYNRREFNQEFRWVRFNASRAQSCSSGDFNRETARAMRDMLNEALGEES